MKWLWKWTRRLLFLVAALYLIGLGALYFGQEFFIFRPETLDESFAFQFEDPYEEIWLETADGAQVNALHFKSDSSKGVLLHLHGNGGCLQRTASIYKAFTDQNLDFFAIDYRTYGKSTGDRSVEGFIADAEAAYSFLKDRHPENQIRVYGQSLGTGIATAIAAAHSPHSLTLEAPYTAIADVAAGDFPIFPVRPLLKYPFECIETIPRVNCPVLVFHGTNDRTIPYWQGKKVAESAPNGTLATMIGEGHRLSSIVIHHPDLFPHLLK